MLYECSRQRVITIFLCLLVPSLLAQSIPLDHLRVRAQKAKDAGKTTLLIQQRSNLDGTDDPLPDVLRMFTLVLVTPIDSAVVRQDNTINTWYKFRILETISKSPKCTECSDPLYPPASLLPTAVGDILVPLPGGTAHIDGVAVTVKSDYVLTPKQGERYLLLLDIYPNRTGFLGGGEAGIYKVLADDRIVMSGVRQTRLKRDFMNYSNLSDLKLHLSDSR